MRHNAQRIEEAVRALALEPGDRLLLLGHSKGLTDILRFLVDYPDPARRVAAVIGVFGAVMGTPLADRYESAYGRWLADLALEGCPPGDGKPVESLTRREQSGWLAAHRLPRHVRYYSLATFAQRERMGRLQYFGRDRLSQISPRNDSQLLFHDQIIPGSTLLGYVNADHWTVALALDEKWPFLVGSGGRPFPREALFEALVLYVAEQLGQDTTPSMDFSPQRAQRGVDRGQIEFGIVRALEKIKIRALLVYGSVFRVALTLTGTVTAWNISTSPSAALTP